MTTSSRSPAEPTQPAGELEGRRWQGVAEAVGRQVGIPVLLAIVALTARVAGAGFLVTDVFTAVDSFDREAAADVVEDRTATLDTLSGIGAIPADTLTVAVLWVAAMALGAWWTRRWEVPVFLLAAIGGEKLTYLFASMIVGRPRPDVPALGHTYATNAFPSGHVASAVSLYGGLAMAALWVDAGRRDGRLRPVAVRVVLGVVVAAIALFVAWSRTYRGHHYVSDVVAGAVLGVIWLWVAWKIVLAPREPPAGRPRRA